MGLIDRAVDQLIVTTKGRPILNAVLRHLLDD